MKQPVKRRAALPPSPGAKAIIVTGTPGTGKTAIARCIAQKLGYQYVDGARLIREQKLSCGYDQKRHCLIVDEARLRRALVSLITHASSPVVIDSHLSQCLSPEHASLCIVTKCHLTVLKRRLERRGYSAAKVRENLDAEIFDSCLTEAAEQGHSILVLDTTAATPGQVIDKKTLSLL